MTRKLTMEDPIAFAFDTNAIYRLGLGNRGADALDFLRTQHQGPLIVPGQTIQEVWNNLLAGVEPQAKVVRRAFDELEKEMAKVDQHLGATAVAAQKAVADLMTEHAEWIDPQAVKSFDSALDVFVKRGRQSFVPRAGFEPLARIRHETKTPPGFKDEAANHGDFFVWADFLYGLCSAVPGTFKSAVLVTNDSKPDWSRNGSAHPILSAEATAAGGVPFSLWTLKEFQSYVKDFGS